MNENFFGKDKTTINQVCLNPKPVGIGYTWTLSIIPLY